jgi:phosphomannomutase/phosphoglucomutase
MSTPAAEIFKAYDIRGIVRTALTADTVALIGRALGSEAAARGVKAIVIGRDGRLSGPELARALAKGITASGIDVIDIGRVPTPMTYFAAHELGTDSCVSVTGSHNPPEYNGLKMVLGGQTLYGEMIQDLRRRIADNDFREGRGMVHHASVRQAYIDRIVGDVKLARPMKIVVDCGNGVAGSVAPDFPAHGLPVKELFCDVNGNFPNHHPDPSKPENLLDLQRALRETGAELGLAFDGDGDRLGVVTKRRRDHLSPTAS